MKTTKARKRGKVEARKTPAPVVPLATPRAPTRVELLESLGEPMTLDDVVIVGRRGLEYEKLVITGAELAHLLSLRDQYNNMDHMAAAEDVPMMLRGLSELLEGHEDGNRLGGDGAFFLANALEALAVRLEAAIPNVGAFNVFLRTKSAAGKVGAA